MLPLRANSCALALLPLSGLSGVYLVCVPGAQRESAHPGEHSQTHSSHPPPTPTNTTTNNNTNVNPSFLNPTLLLSLCLNERKALWVGNALHQTLRGESYRGEHERRSVRGRKSGVEAQCVWWGSVKVGGHKLIITIDG